MRSVRPTIVTVGKKRITYSQYVSVALGIQHRMRMRYNVVCGLSSFYHIFLHCYKRHDCQEKVTKHKACEVKLKSEVKW